MGLIAAEKAGLRIVFPFEIQRLDMPVGDKLEERALIALSVDYAYTLDQDVGRIDQATIQLRVDEAEETISHA